jgi:hypothetical protein
MDGLGQRVEGVVLLGGGGDTSEAVQLIEHGLRCTPLSPNMANFATLSLCRSESRGFLEKI